jgi:F0F1-type ATP synthase assembly protein I
VAPKNRNPWVMVGEYTTLALVLPASTALGYLAGYFLDRWLGTDYLKVVFLLLGIAAGFVELIRLVQKDTGGGE